MDGSSKEMTTTEFEKILGRIGFRIEESRMKVYNYHQTILSYYYLQLKMGVILEDLTFGGVMFNKMRLKKKYEKYSVSRKEDSN